MNILPRTKRWRSVLLAIFVSLVLIGTIRWIRTRQIQRKRDAAYQLALESYSKVLKPEMTRTEVESYLSLRKIPIQKTYGFDHSNFYTDLIHVGEDPAPWYCDKINVYIAVEFNRSEEPSSTDQASLDKPESTDTVKRLAIFRMPGACL